MCSLGKAVTFSCPEALSGLMQAVKVELPRFCR